MMFPKVPASQTAKRPEAGRLAGRCPITTGKVAFSPVRLAEVVSANHQTRRRLDPATHSRNVGEAQATQERRRGPVNEDVDYRRKDVTSAISAGWKSAAGVLRGDQHGWVLRSRPTRMLPESGNEGGRPHEPALGPIRLAGHDDHDVCCPPPRPHIARTHLSTAARLVLPLPLGIEIKPCLGRPRAREQPAEDVPLPLKRPFGRPSRGSPSKYSRANASTRRGPERGKVCLDERWAVTAPFGPAFTGTPPGCDSA